MSKTIVLIPHYNNFIGLVKTIASIDDSESLDVLVIDDGSDQPINELILKKNCFFKGELLIKYLEKNYGIEAALNFGLKTISKINTYEYIARIDSGDICLGKRFAIQELFLDSNPSIYLVGSNAIAVDIEGNTLYKTILPEKHSQIVNHMFVNAMFLHPCVMFRTEVLNTIEKYPTEYPAAEDYAFFFNIISKFKTYNIQEYLVKYEINHKGISLTKRKQQIESRIKIIKKNYYFGYWPTYGLLRNYLLLIVPNQLIQFIKRHK